MQNDLSNMQEYIPTRGGRATQRRCRLSLRRGGTELAIVIPNDIATAAGIAIGEQARLLFDQDKLAIVATSDGGLRIRKIKSGNNILPHLLIPIGPERPFSVTFAKAGTIECEHTVDDTRLVLVLPKTITLTVHG